MQDILGDLWILLKGDLVCLAPSDTLDSVYEGQHGPGRPLDDLFRAHPRASSVWACSVESGNHSNQEPNTLLWVRAAPWMHSTASTEVLCPFCRVPVPGWGAHLSGACIKLTQALLYAFRAVASHLASLGFDIHWRGVVCFIATPPAALPVVVSLVHDEGYSTCLLSHQAVAITWSGLWIDHDGARLGSLWQVLLHHYTTALIQAARGEVWPLFEDINDRDTFSSDFGVPWRIAARVQALVQVAGCEEWDTPARLWSSSVGLRGLNGGSSASTLHRALWGPQPAGPIEGVSDWTFARLALRQFPAGNHVQFCGAGLILHGPAQLLPAFIRHALSLINSNK